MIGSDSVVSVDGRLFDKPRDRDEAAEHLRFFSGKAMRLTSAVALARGGQVDWRHADTATLCGARFSRRASSPHYLDAEWPEVGYSVGVFRLEGRGVQLFDAIEGDHFTILGMPLLPLLGALRERGLIAGMIKIALTGSIGMGKSTVAKMFEAPAFRCSTPTRWCAGCRDRAARWSSASASAFPGRSRTARSIATPRQRRCLATRTSSARSKRSFIPRCVHAREPFHRRPCATRRRCCSKSPCCSKPAAKPSSTR